MPRGYLRHCPKGDVCQRKMRGGGSGKSSGSSCRRRLKEVKLGADGLKAGSRGHGGKGAFERDLMAEVQWSRRCANNAKRACHDERPSTPLTDATATKPPQ